MRDFREICEEWQKIWEERKIFEAEPDERPKFYLTVAYPYVSGPMHIGHGRTYTVPDVIARYKRMRGYNVLFPMAYHFTGTPIVGAARRVARRDPTLVRVLTERYGVPKEMLPKFENPEFYGNFFAKESEMSYRKGMEKLGYSIDWRREFRTIDPHYKKFVTWQYHKLWDAGLIVKGRHPVRWCTNCGNPVTDHDLLEGEGVEVLEFTIIKYRMGDLVFPAATLRPETLFGLTNIWLNPNSEYVVVSVDDEKWVVSKQAVDKLRMQGYRVGELEPFEIKFGALVEVPITKKKVPILPATFVDPDNVTGVVGSVPAHAPYDYVALENLKSSDLSRWGIGKDLVEKLSPIGLIEVEGYGEFPAVDVVRKMGISNQTDPRLEEATKEVYRAEFLKGTMRSWIPKYGGMKVSEAKVAVKEDLIKSGDGAIMYEFAEKPVTCRCGTGVTIKIVEDQWFIDYGREDWKKMAKKCLSMMHLVPPETRTQFEYTIEWLKEWPCTRKIGMGTPAPWDPSWIIESLSDSTIYMAYYTISHILKTIDAEKLNDEVFDYVFYGKGDITEIARKSGIEREKLEKMRKEFTYWYPLDYRMSADELIPNHLTFHIFHHALLFPDACPRGIVSFGMVILEGQKMSSSKGNIVAISEAVKEFGADTVRLHLLAVAEPWQDLDWRSEEVKATHSNLRRFASLVDEILSIPVEDGETGRAEQWILSRMNFHLGETTAALEAFETRKAAQHAFYMMMQDVRRYLERSTSSAKGKVLRDVLDVWIRMLAPFIPHVCEEIWKMMGKDGFVSLANWPSVEVRNLEVEFAEAFVDEIVEDISEIKKVIGKETPDIVCIYVAEEWKWKVCRMALEQMKKGKIDFDALLTEARRFAEDMTEKELAKILQTMIAEVRKASPEEIEAIRKGVNEFDILSDAIRYIAGQVGAREVRVFRESDEEKYDPAGRAKRSLPLRPAVYVE